jgi:hypothetical protein
MKNNTESKDPLSTELYTILKMIKLNREVKKSHKWSGSWNGEYTREIENHNCLR